MAAGTLTTTGTLATNGTHLATIDRPATRVLQATGGHMTTTRRFTTLVTEDVSIAAAFVREGECVAFPTETVYGLGADATLPGAVARIFEAKGRPGDNPLIVHVADVSLVETVASNVPRVAQLILDRFAPGPVTVILPRGERIAPQVSAGRDTVGIRIPAHATARAFLLACGVPVAAPSANRSGRPSPTTWQAVQTDLDGRIPCILKGSRARVGLESTVVDCTGSIPLVLRAGAITLEALRAVAPGVRMAGADDPAAAHSPGTRHPHYAPHAEVRIVDRAVEARALEAWIVERAVAPPTGLAWIGLGSAPAGYDMVSEHADVASYAHALFDFFRRCDEAEMTRIDCRPVPRRGLGRALMDRIERGQQAPRP